jgi:NADPH-dependent 7-cyano-7-deazaguanine reductase QueF-like protein
MPSLKECRTKMTFQEIKFAELVGAGEDVGDAYALCWENPMNLPTKTLGKTLINKKKYVKEFIRLKQIGIAERTKLSADVLIGKHMAIIDNYEYAIDLIKKDNKTQQEIDRIYQLKGFISSTDYKNALREMGLLTGLYVTKIEVKDTTVRINVITEKFEDMSFEELPNSKLPIQSSQIKEIESFGQNLNSLENLEVDICEEHPLSDISPNQSDWEGAGGDDCRIEDCVPPEWLDNEQEDMI